MLRTPAPLTGDVGRQGHQLFSACFALRWKVVWKRALSIQGASLFVSWVAAVRLLVALQVGVGVANVQSPWLIV